MPSKKASAKSKNTSSSSTETREQGMVRRAVSRIRSMFARSENIQQARGGEDRELPIPVTSETAQTAAARAPRRTSDVTLDQLENDYTPTQTSLKTSFRDDGVARQRDQSFAADDGDARWNDEDHFTNRSHDPRIGTHGRTYEAGETRDTSRE
jgi:hypothetical protein